MRLAADPADLGVGYQMYTAVIRKHRGHRLGLLVKVAMMELLATTEPQLERIVTSNARSNETRRGRLTAASRGRLTAAKASRRS